MEINETLSFRDLAKLLSIGNNKLTRLTKDGMPFIQLGGDRKVFLKQSILEWLRNREKQLFLVI